MSPAPTGSEESKRGRVRRRSGAGAPDREPLPPGFFTIWSTVAIDLIGFGIVLPILPRYAERFGATPFTIGLMVASFSLAQLVCAPLWGRLSDRIGRKPILIVSLFGTAVGSLLTGVAGAVWVLFLGRIIDGVSGASVSVAQAAASDLAPPHRRAQLMGLLGAAFGVGFVAGPAIGGLGARISPELPFYIAAALSFVNALVAIRRLPETSPAHQRPDTAAEDAERIAAALPADGPGLVEPAHLERPPASHLEGPPAPLWPDTAAGGAPVDVRLVIRLILVSFVGMIAFSGFEATFALFGEKRLGLQLDSTGAVFALIGIALVIVQGGLVGRVNDALGEVPTLRAGLVANAAGLAMLAVDRGWASVAPALLLLVVGQGLLTPTLSSAVAGRAGSARGQWLGWQQSAGGVARVIGPSAAGALFQYVGVGVPYIVGAGLVVVALALLPVG